MATSIRVPMDGDPAGKLEEIRQRAKQLRSDLRDTQRDMMDTARTGQAVSKDVAENYKRIRADLKNMEEMGKRVKAQQKQIDDYKRRSGLSGDGEASDKAFGRGDVRKLHALKELAEGKVSPHSIKHVAEMFGLEGVAASMAAITPAVMVGQMVVQHFTEKYEKETEKIMHDAEHQNKILDKAKHIGMDSRFVTKIDEKITDKWTKIAKSRSAASIRNPLYYETVEQIMEGEKPKIEKEQEQQFAMLEHLRGMDTAAFGVSKDKVYRAARDKNRKFNPTTEMLNAARDEMLLDVLDKLEVRNAVLSSQETAKKMAAEKQAKAARMEWDQDFAQSERDKKELSSLVFNMYHKRFAAAPTD